MDINLIDELLEKNGYDYNDLINSYAVEYLQDNNCDDDILLIMETEFNDYYNNKEPMDIIYSVNAGYDYGTEEPFNINAPYFFLNGYANPVSVYNSEEYYNDIIDKDDFIEWCIDNDYLEIEETED